MKMSKQSAKSQRSSPRYLEKLGMGFLLFSEPYLVRITFHYVNPNRSDYVSKDSGYEINSTLNPIVS